jgi:hypothetical protein
MNRQPFLVIVVLAELTTQLTADRRMVTDGSRRSRRSRRSR